MQKNFLSNSLHYLAAQTAYRIGQHFYHQHLKTRGINAAEYWVLTQLVQQNGRTVGEISRQIFYDQPATTRLLERMAEKKLIERRGTPSDKRKMLAFLTKRGSVLASELQTIADKDERAGIKSFTAEELALCKSWLLRAIDDLEKRDAADSG